MTVRMRQPASVRRQHGLTLVEMMISMILGLLVIAAVISVFLTSQQAYNTNSALAQVQNSARIAFGMMARDIRGAGSTGCTGASGRIANVLNNGPNGTGTGGPWYANFAKNALQGFDGDETDSAADFGNSEGQRVKGTDSLRVMSAGDTSITIVPSSGGNPANIKINKSSNDIGVGDIVMVCNPDHTVIFQITKYNNSNVTVVHNAGSKVKPGNCSKGLGYPTNCGSTNGNAYTFPANSKLMTLSATDWYIGHNPVGGKSLYRVTVEGDTPDKQELVRGVTDMQITYHRDTTNNYVKASKVSGVEWSQVTTVHITLTLQSTNERAGTDQKPLQRQLDATVALQNRV